MENKRGKDLPFVGSEAFGFDEKDVIEALKDAQDNAAGFRELLNDPNERLRESAASILEVKEEEIKVLSSGSPKQVLGRVKSFYDRAVSLGSTGIDEEQLSEKLSSEFPDIPSYYGLLRKKTWGYRLGQAVMAINFNKQ